MNPILPEINSSFCISVANKTLQFLSRKDQLAIVQDNGMALEHLPENFKVDS
ncbi:MAG: hypothetical protein ACRCU0_01895 [Candidatus Rhabdochlamydia sp.]